MTIMGVTTHLGGKRVVKNARENDHLSHMFKRATHNSGGYTKEQSAVIKIKECRHKNQIYLGVLTPIPYTFKD